LLSRMWPLYHQLYQILFERTIYEDIKSYKLLQ